jgi:cell division GTPase FtsZ
LIFQFTAQRAYSSLIAGGDDLTMFEIQEAAKIITESVDPNAKIIFGTVRDEKLRKNEIKVTVIASGFPEILSKNARHGLLAVLLRSAPTRLREFLL